MAFNFLTSGITSGLVAGMIHIELMLILFNKDDFIEKHKWPNR